MAQAQPQRRRVRQVQPQVQTQLQCHYCRHVFSDGRADSSEAMYGHIRNAHAELPDARNALLAANHLGLTTLMPLPVQPQALPMQHQSPPSSLQHKDMFAFVMLVSGCIMLFALFYCMVLRR
jgi:hypothetical protein